MKRTSAEPHSVNGYYCDIRRLRWRTTIHVRNLCARVIDDDALENHLGAEVTVDDFRIDGSDAPVWPYSADHLICFFPSAVFFSAVSHSLPVNMILSILWYQPNECYPPQISYIMESCRFPTITVSVLMCLGG